MIDQRKEIYSTDEIPLFCEHCGKYISSRQYRLMNSKNPIKGWTSAIIGTCPSCGDEVERVFPSGRELGDFTRVLTLLTQSGRLKDERFNKM